LKRGVRPISLITTTTVSSMSRDATSPDSPDSAVINSPRSVNSVSKKPLCWELSTWVSQLLEGETVTHRVVLLRRASTASAAERAFWGSPSETLLRSRDHSGARPELLPVRQMDLQMSWESERTETPFSTAVRW
jgi:hypothetical protein